MTKATKITENENGVTWYEVNGTEWGFDKEVFGMTDDGRLLDCDGCPMTNGDRQEICAREAIGNA